MKKTCFHNQLRDLHHGSLAQLRHPGHGHSDERTKLTDGLFNTVKKASHFEKASHHSPRTVGSMTIRTVKGHDDFEDTVNKVRHGRRKCLVDGTVRGGRRHACEKMTLCVYVMS